MVFKSHRGKGLPYICEKSIRLHLEISAFIKPTKISSASAAKTDFWGQNMQIQKPNVRDYTTHIVPVRETRVLKYHEREIKK